jgi:hypothetical protein
MVKAKKYANFLGFMTPTPPPQPSDKKTPVSPCKHPRVQIVSREEDSEFVECIECGDIFEASEFKDMTIEETKLNKEP